MAATVFFWDPVEDNVLQSERDTNELANYNTEPSRLGRVLSVSTTSTTSYLHTDATGSVISATDSAQAVSGSWAYSAFGQSIESTGSHAGDVGFIGAHGYQVAHTDTFYVRHRTYESQRIRWLSIDLLGQNRYFAPYIYASNDPTQFVDPTGLICQDGSPCAKLKTEKGCKGLVKREKPLPWTPGGEAILGLAYCKKGKVTYELYKKPEPGEPPHVTKYRQDPCIMKCVEEHEKQHVKDITTRCPFMCECYKGEEFDISYAKDGFTESFWECPAYAVAMRCLKRYIDMDRPVEAVDGVRVTCDLESIRKLYEDLSEKFRRGGECEWFGLIFSHF